jgi:hypothetical protein
MQTISARSGGNHRGAAEKQGNAAMAPLSSFC